MKIWGVDPSTKTGAVYVDWTDPDKPQILHRSTLVAPKGMNPNSLAEDVITRAHHIGEQLIALIQSHDKPDGAVIEGFGFAKAQGVDTMVLGAYIGMHLRYRLATTVGDWEVIAPRSLKKFATGNGNASKDKMMLEAHRRFDIFFDSNDEADAFWLSAAGAVAKGLKVPLPISHTEDLKHGTDQNL